MVFSTMFFLTIFLPPVLFGAWLLRAWAVWRERRTGVARNHRLENLWILAASLFFYFWGEGWGVVWLIANVAFNATCAAVLSRRENPGWRKGWLAFAVAGNLAALGWFKYAGLAARTLNLLPGVSVGIPEVALPLGISFYTFQAMSYVVDVYRGTARSARRVGDFACYVTMFPQLVAGPIVRYTDIAAELEHREWRLEQVASGMRRFLCGLAKKALVANGVGAFADVVWEVLGGGSAVPPSLAWLGLLCYTLQIYYDFSGYSDMAIGLGRMFGFEFQENFRHPYGATSVRDFWRKWHISLSSWFRDYLYIPLGGSRCGAVRTAVNGLVVFGLCGLWHGASWMFLLWGLWHGLFLMLERPRRKSETPSGWRALVGHIYALAVVGFGWVLFRSEGFGEVARMLESLVGAGITTAQSRLLWMHLSPRMLIIVVIGVIGAFPVARLLEERLRRWLPETAVTALAWVWCTLAGAVAILEVAAGAYNPFLYFRF